VAFKADANPAALPVSIHKRYQHPEVDQDSSGSQFGHLGSGQRLDVHFHFDGKNAIATNLALRGVWQHVVREFGWAISSRHAAAETGDHSDIASRGKSRVLENHGALRFSRDNRIDQIGPLKSQIGAIVNLVGQKLLSSRVLLPLDLRLRLQDSDHANHDGDKQRTYFYGRGPELPVSNCGEFFAGFRHAPLLAQIAFFAAVGASAQVLLIGGGCCLLLWRRRWLGSGLLGLGLLGFGLGIWSGWRLSECHPGAGRYQAQSYPALKTHLPLPLQKTASTTLADNGVWL
jgi:hypothetical protein